MTAMDLGGLDIDRVASREKITVLIRERKLAIIMFGVLGMLPGYVLAKILNGMGKLRIPRDVEIAGLDYEIMEDDRDAEKAVASSTR